MWDGTIVPPGHKRFIVVYAADGWLLRINTKSVWKPCWQLSAAANPGCLDYDSWLEFRGVIEYLPSELDDAEHLGRLSDSTLQALVAYLPSALTLTAEQIEQIIDEISATLP
jgi:hypothetical protein